jgi:hypothetical protein
MTPRELVALAEEWRGLAGAIDQMEIFFQHRDLEEGSRHGMLLVPWVPEGSEETPQCCGDTLECQARADGGDPMASALYSYIDTALRNAQDAMRARERNITQAVRDIRIDLTTGVVG